LRRDTYNFNFGMNSTRWVFRCAN